MHQVNSCTVVIDVYTHVRYEAITIIGSSRSAISKSILQTYEIQFYKSEILFQKVIFDFAKLMFTFA